MEYYTSEPTQKNMKKAKISEQIKHTTNIYIRRNVNMQVQSLKSQNSKKLDSINSAEYKKRRTFWAELQAALWLVRDIPVTG